MYDKFNYVIYVTMPDLVHTIGLSYTVIAPELTFVGDHEFGRKVLVAAVNLLTPVNRFYGGDVLDLGALGKYFVHQTDISNSYMFPAIKDVYGHTNWTVQQLIPYNDDKEYVFL